MPDIFLSYSREDQATARRFAEAFEREGLDVWWDATLHSGEAYDQVTEKALREAKAVVVLWSRASVDSRWVRAEATTADRNKTLVPVMIEDCLRPVMFELTHTADLSQWKGDSGDPLWKTYVADVRRFVHRGESATSAPARAAMSAGPAPATRFSGKVLGIIAVAIIGTVGVLWMVMHPRGEPDTPVPPPPPSVVAPAASAAASRASVAVMPFANLTGDPSKDYLGDGMAEELINLLVKVPGLTVPSRTSSFAYKGRNTDLKQIAKDLNVSTILEGSVRSAGETIRITAQLIDAQSDRHIWSQTYDRKFTDVFKLQDDLAHEIVTAFKTTMNADLPEFETGPPPTSDPEAYALFLQGNSHVNRNSDTSLADAIKAYERAIARDPKFGAAYLGIATAHNLYGSPLADVERNARKGAELDPGLAVAAQRILAAVEAKRSNWVGAEELFQSISRSTGAPDRSPEHALSTWWPAGQLRNVMLAYTEAQRRAPAAAAMSLVLGMAYSAKGEDEVANRYVNAAVELGVDPNARRTLQVYANTAERAGRFNDAAEYVTRALPEGARAAGAVNAVKLVYAARAGASDKKPAVAALDELMPKLDPVDWVVKVWAMAWYVQLGEMGRAFSVADQLRQQFADLNPTNAWSWLWSPELRTFRQDPRFQPFMTRLGMMGYWEKFGPPDDCDLKNGKLTCH